MKKPFYKFILIFILFIAGCAKPRPTDLISLTNTVTPFLTQTPTLTTIPLPSLTPTITLTLTPSLSPTPSLTPTMTVPPDAHITINCLDVQKDYHSGGFEGGIILEKIVSQNAPLDTEVWLEDLKTGEFTLLNQDNENVLYLFRYRVSPDSQNIAIERELDVTTAADAKKDLVLMDGGGKRLALIPWENSGIIEWLDNQHLLAGITGNSMIFNPFTREKRIIQLSPAPGDKYPVTSMVPPFIWGGWNGTVYDPTLTRFVYVRNSHDYYPYVLWDTQEQKALVVQVASPENFLEPSAIPRWSPDGQQVIVYGTTNPGFVGADLFSISVDGKLVEQLTHLGNYYLTLRFHGVSWSPDGSHVATWLDINPDDNSSHLQLAVLDLTTHQVINYCIEGNTIINGLQDIDPIWSPDGKQLLVVSYIPNSSFTGDWLNDIKITYTLKDVVVDIANNTAVQVAEGYIPLGWLKAP